MPQDLGLPPDLIAIPGASVAPGEPPRPSNMAEMRGPGCGPGPARASVASPDGPGPLPCPHTCNNSTEPIAAFPAAAGRPAFALKVNVQSAVERWGLSHTGFLTLTFADHV